jgi:hypothetical protein
MSWDTGAVVGGGWDSGAGAMDSFNEPSANDYSAGGYGGASNDFGHGNGAGGFGEGGVGDSRGNNRGGCYNCGQEG